MYVDVTALRDFYKSHIGQQVKRALLPDLEKKGLFQQGQLTIGMGYALPYFPEILPLNSQILALMPARQGAIAWPNRQKNCTILVEEHLLPLANESVDIIFLIHILEFSQNAQALLAEIWRVLVPSGRIIIVVPNRNGIWSHYEHTPFGHGVPYSRTQIQNLLRKSGFAISSLEESLYFPPAENSLWRFIAMCHMRLVAARFPYFGGVLMAEAEKEVYKAVCVENSHSQKVILSTLPVNTVPSRSSL